MSFLLLILGSETTKERLRKLKAVTAEETQEQRKEIGNDEISDDSHEDEIFELIDESGVQESGKKKRKGRKMTSIEKNKSEKKEKKRKKVKEKKMKNEEEVKLKGKKNGKKKKVILKEDIEESKKVEDQTEGDEVKKDAEECKDTKKAKSKVKKKRKNSEENGRKEKSKKSKKARIQENMQEETEQNGTLVDDEEKLLIEGEVIEDDELLQIQKLDAEIPAERVSETQVTLNPKNVFQIEDLGEENDFLNDTDDDNHNEIYAQRMTIQEAFANDDVIEEFVKEKADKTEASKPKDLDLSLPGWGDWGGPGIDETKRRKKFTILAKPAAPRKDTKLAHVIINEERDKKFAKNQVPGVLSIVLEQ